MRRAFSLALLFACLFFIYQFGVTFIKNTHQETYTMQNNNKIFEIKETFKNKHYFIDIKTENYSFTFEQKNEFNKQKEIIEDIIWKEKNGLLCIYPVYKENKDTYFLCNDTKKIYTRESLKNNEVVKELEIELIEKGYKNNNQETEIEKRYNQVSYYTNAIKETIALWYYQGFLKITNQGLAYHEFLNFDRYENTLSGMVGKYYLSPVYTGNKLFECQEFEVFDVTNNYHFRIPLDVTLSNFSYKNGVIDGKLYIFDKKNMTQIAIDPKKKTSEIVGNQEKGGQDYQGKWESKSIYDFSNTIIKFQEYETNELIGKYSYNFITADTTSYYFYDGEGMYQVYKNNIDQRILLLKQKNMKEIQVVKDNIYYIVDNTLYRYNKLTGTNRLVVYNDLRYNSENIYEVYYK